VYYYAGDGRRSHLSEVGRPGSARYAIEWELGEQRGGRRGNGSHDYRGTDECNTHSRGAKKDAKATSNLERWKEWQSVSTLGRDSIRGSPWVQQHPRKLASPWPGDLKRSNTSGANQGAWGLGGLRRTCLGWPAKFIRQGLGRMSSSWLNAGFKLFYATSSPA
jgi:hypothetical protein